LKSPSDLAGVDEHQVSASPDEDPKGCPHLPRHDETSTNIGRSRFCRVDWNRDFFQTHADAKQDTCCDELTPFLRERHTKGGAEAEDRSEEDCTSTGEEIVDRVRDPGRPVAISIGKLLSGVSYKTQMVMYGAELMKPMIQEFLLQIASVGHCGEVSEIPRASANVRLAPLEAANVSIVVGRKENSYQSDPILG